MYLILHICIHVDMQVCIFMSVYVCTYLCMCVLYMSICLYIPIYVCIHVCNHVCVFYGHSACFITQQYYMLYSYLFTVGYIYLSLMYKYFNFLYIKQV